MIEGRQNKKPKKRHNEKEIRWTFKTNGKLEEKQRWGVEKIKQHIKTLELPPSIEIKSKNIFRESHNRNLLSGRTIHGLTAASVYTGCRKQNYPITLGEISDISKADKREISSIYRSIKRELNLTIAPTGPKPYIYRYSKELDLDKEIRDKALEILEKTKGENISTGKSPNGYAASTLYLASKLSNKKIPQKTLAKTANTTRVTIRNTYKKQITEIPSKTLNSNNKNIDKDT